MWGEQKCNFKYLEMGDCDNYCKDRPLPPPCALIILILYTPITLIFLHVGNIVTIKIKQHIPNGLSPNLLQISAILFAV